MFLRYTYYGRYGTNALKIDSTPFWNCEFNYLVPYTYCIIYRFIHVYSILIKKTNNYMTMGTKNIILK